MRTAPIALAIAIVALAGPAPVRASPDDRPALVFRGDDGTRCRSFLITEFGLFYGTPRTSPIGAASPLVGVIDYGWMKNMGAQSALGATLFGENGSDGNKGGLRLRYRRWLGRRFALDVSPGVVLISNSDYQTPGLIAQVGVSAGDVIGVMAEAEVARTRQWTGAVWDPEGRGFIETARMSTDTSFRVGVKGGSYVGVGATLASAVLVAVVAASLSGSSW